MSWTLTPPASLSPILLAALRAPICGFGQIRFARTIAKFNGPVAEGILLSKGPTVRWIQVLISNALALSIFSLSSVVAQSAFTGGLTGVISGPNGAVVSSVTIEITNQRTGKVERSISSEADGSYSAMLLPPGTYRLRVAAANFKQSIIEGVQVRINETSRQDVKLAVGDITDIFQVVAAPSLINPVSPITGQSVDAATLKRLPLTSHNALFLLSLSSGTFGDLADVRTIGRGTASITVDGGRTSNNYIGGLLTWFLL